MRDLKFTCPTTGHQIDSGIETDPNTLRRIELQALHIVCPHCCETHQIPIKNGHFDKAA